MATFSKPRRRVKNGRVTGKYWVRVSEGGRRTWRSTGKTNYKLALEVKRGWELKDAKGERHIENMSLSDAADRWLEGKQARVSPACYRVYSVYVRHWKGFFSKALLRSLEPEDLERYFTRRAADGATPRTLNNERAQLRSLLELARGRGWLFRNPLEHVEKFRETRRQIRTLEEKEERTLLKAAEKVGDQVHGFIRTLLESGLRRGTVAKLGWEDIDFAAGEWRIPAAKVKAREDFVGRPIAPELLAYLRERAKTSGPVFGPLEVKHWRAATAAAGLSWLKPHDLRRNFVTRCRRAGVPLEVTMFLSDHRDVKVVLECYRQVDARDAKGAIRKVFGDERVHG